MAAAASHVKPGVSQTSEAGVSGYDLGTPATSFNVGAVVARTIDTSRPPGRGTRMNNQADRDV